MGGKRRELRCTGHGFCTSIYPMNIAMQYTNEFEVKIKHGRIAHS